MSTTTPFCTDVDLLHWEPTLLRDATFASQTLLSGSGLLTSTSFEISTGSLLTTNIKPQQVIILGEGVNGCFPISSIDDETTLTLSVLYDELAEQSSPVAGAPPTESEIPFVIRTFWPQRTVVSELLMQAAGVGASRDGESPATILNPDALRRACTLGTLQMIYSALSAAAEDGTHFDVRADLYERLYRRALRSAKVEIDLNGDGEADVVRSLNVVSFLRA